MSCTVPLSTRWAKNCGDR